jgi:hypothetical protein
LAVDARRIAVGVGEMQLGLAHKVSIWLFLTNCNGSSRNWLVERL